MCGYCYTVSLSWQDAVREIYIQVPCWIHLVRSNRFFSITAVYCYSALKNICSYIFCDICRIMLWLEIRAL